MQDMQIGRWGNVQVQITDVQITDVQTSLGEASKQLM